MPILTDKSKPNHVTQVVLGTGDVVIVLASPVRNAGAFYNDVNYVPRNANEIVILNARQSMNPIGEDSEGDYDGLRTDDGLNDYVRLTFTDVASLRVLINQAEELEARMLDKVAEAEHYARLGQSVPELKPFDLTMCPCGDANCEGCEADKQEAEHSARWAQTRMVVNPRLAGEDD